ncbi:MAG: hypothetical protein RL017_47 [Pseudomonadota bacterium]|jgi:H+/gluconate symporter-like permease|nr:TRAP transporter large permease subunit [Burkholderiales bacterium]
MHYTLTFWWQLSSLALIIIYAVLVFKNVEPLVAILICVILGFLLNKSTPIAVGANLEQALSGFLALIGFIIMLGRGLGEVLAETKVSHTLVYKIVYGIGINTQRKVKIGVIISSITIVGVLGTLAGGIAILAPILRPIAGKVGLNKPSLAVLMQASGEEALILGPFAPPVVALLGVSHISYISMLLYASIPIALVTIITTWIIAGKLQQQYPKEKYSLNLNDNQFVPNKQQNISTLIFIFGFVFCVCYGFISHAKTSYVIFVMLFLAIVTGLCGGLNLNKIVTLIISGMQKNLNLFVMFVLLDPMLSLIQQAGGFNALTALLTPLVDLGGKQILPIVTGLTGAFGMPAASAAVIQLLSKLFSPAAIALNLSTLTFAFSMLLATRITNFAYPGPNMFAAMGFAESTNLKAMIKNGLTVTCVQVTFLIIYSMLFA